VTDAEYRLTQSHLTSWAQLTNAMLSELELDAFLDRLNRADTLGWVLDPTLAMRASDGVRQVEGLARLARDTQAALLRLAGTQEER
jgi:hypothetical protein